MSRSNNEARKRLIAALRKLKAERKKTTQLESELRVVNAENKSMKMMVKTGSLAMGRNKVSKLKYDGFMKANKSSFVEFVKHKVFPHHNFLHTSWRFYSRR